MADQAAVSGATAGNGVRINAPAESMVGSLAEFGHDITTLAELQAKLAAVDAKEALGRALVPGAMAAAGLALLLGSLPVLLLGVAEWLHDTGLMRGPAYLLTGGVALVLALLLAAMAGRALVRSFESFRRSREELERNISWIKTVLLFSGRMTTRRRR